MLLAPGVSTELPLTLILSPRLSLGAPGPKDSQGAKLIGHSIPILRCSGARSGNLEALPLSVRVCIKGWVEVMDDLEVVLLGFIWVPHVEKYAELVAVQQQCTAMLFDCG